MFNYDYDKRSETDYQHFSNAITLFLPLKMPQDSPFPTGFQASVYVTALHLATDYPHLRFAFLCDCTRLKFHNIKKWMHFQIIYMSSAAIYSITLVSKLLLFICSMMLSTWHFIRNLNKSLAHNWVSFRSQHKSVDKLQRFKFRFKLLKPLWVQLTNVWHLTCV